MNYAHYEGKGIDVKEVIDLAETMPFFSNVVCLCLRIQDFLKALPVQNWQSM